MKTTSIRRALLILCGWFCQQAGAAALDTNAVVAAWLGSQTNIQTLAADLTQTRKLKALAEPLVTKGRLWFEPPGRFRWELGVPAQTIVVKDGKELFMISPRLNTRCGRWWRRTGCSSSASNRRPPPPGA